MQLYVDHFSKELKGLESKLGYFEKLGVNFLDLMPIAPRPKDLISGRATNFIEGKLELKPYQ
jgi:glycosidase